MRTIKVTKEDIKAADKWRKRGSHKTWGRLCPIGRAVTRKTGKKVWVSPGNIYIGNDNIILPRKASKFIEDWDNEIDVEPFSFTI